MARYGMVIDTKTCVGCMDCVVACKTENQLPQGLDLDWIVYDTKAQYPTLLIEIRSERCNQCDNPHERVLLAKADNGFLGTEPLVIFLFINVVLNNKSLPGSTFNGRHSCRTPDFINLTEARKITGGRSAAR